MQTVGDANNVANIIMDALDNINELMVKIKDATAQAASGAMGTNEKVALAKASYRMAQQIQTVADSTVFGGAQLLNGSYTANFLIGLDSRNTLLSINIDMRRENEDFNIESNYFDVNSLRTGTFGGITGLDLRQLDDVSITNLGIFHVEVIHITLTSLANAIDNINKVAAYLGGISNRLSSQEDLLKNQIVNYKAAISRLEDADVAKEQLQLIKSQFLQQASLISLSQSNQNPNAYMRLLQG